MSQVKTVGAAKGGGLEEEAIRVVSKMPKWKPGKQNGQYVAVYFNLPVSFHLNNN
ncbi:energy transducer TonB [Chitinophaga sp.]|uniref:energy transducer TonB n=1 Tax=Chitinophaga sp. TaxID=1869181 RepID=UPI0039C89D27